MPFAVKIIFVIVQALFKTVHRSLVFLMLPVTTLCFVYHNKQSVIVHYLNASQSACFIHIGIKTTEMNVITHYVICL